MGDDKPAIYLRLRSRLPGLAPVSQLQAYVYLEAYDEGVSAYTRLESPSAEDERWLGLCYLYSFDDLRAAEVLQRAASRGCKEAHVDLARVYLYTERLSDVALELSKVVFTELQGADRVRYLLVKSEFAALQGKLDEALQLAEDAWGQVQALPEHPVLAPQVANQLGPLYARKGRSERALWFVERSLQLSQGLQHDRGRLYRAELNTLLGHLDEAETELRELKGQLAARLESIRLLLSGQLAWARTDLTRAKERLRQAAELARDTQGYFEEFAARLALATLLAYGDDAEGAQAQLARARSLVADPADDLKYRFRSALVRSRRDSSPAILSELETLAEAFAAGSFLQEQGRVRLHIAALKTELGEDPRADLDQLFVLTTRLQTGAFLAPEWALLPALSAEAERSHPGLRLSGGQLDIYTLGEEKLVLDGKTVHVPLRKAVEVIAYLLERGSVSLKKLLLDVFADDSPATARNYFHQLRHELRERVPGLSIRYDAEEKLYSLVSDLRLVWDVAELRAGRVQVPQGALFLPSSGSDWASLLEAELEPLLKLAEAEPATKPS